MNKLYWSIFLWVILSIFVSFFGKDREIGFMGGFIIAIFLSPLIGLFAVLASNKKSEIKKYKKGENLNAEQTGNSKYWPPH